MVLVPNAEIPHLGGANLTKPAMRVFMVRQAAAH